MEKVSLKSIKIVKERSNSSCYKVISTPKNKITTHGNSYAPKESIEYILDASEGIRKLINTIKEHNFWIPDNKDNKHVCTEETKIELIGFNINELM